MTRLAKTHYRGWMEFVHRDPPNIDFLSPSDRSKLDSAGLATYHARRRAAIAGPYLMRTPLYDEMRKRVQQRIAINEHCDPGQKIHPAIQGPSGHGKTMVMHHIAKAIHLREIAEKGATVDVPDYQGPRIPVITVEAPSVRSFKAFIVAQVQFLNPEAQVGGANAEVLATRLLRRLESLGTVLLIIDDAHAIRGGLKTNEATADSIKTFVERLPCTLVILGTEFEDSVWFGSTGGGASDPSAQLRNRFVRVFVEPFAPPKNDKTGLFAAFVRGISKTLPLELHSAEDLTDATTLKWMYGKTGDGIPKRVDGWIRSAAFEAVGTTERVTTDMLEQTPVPGA